MRVFCFFHKVIFRPFNRGFWISIAFSFQDDSIGPMTEAIKGGGAEHLVGREGIAPFCVIKTAAVLPPEHEFGRVL